MRACKSRLVLVLLLFGSEKLARVLSTNHRAKQYKTKANAITIRHSNESLSILDNQVLQPKVKVTYKFTIRLPTSSFKKLFSWESISFSFFNFFSSSLKALFFLGIVNKTNKLIGAVVRGIVFHPMCPGFDSRTRRHKWAGFVGFLLCSERFFSGTPV